MLKTALNNLLHTIAKYEAEGYIAASEAAHNELIGLSRHVNAQVQSQGSAYTYIDPSTIPPAISAILMNLNYQVNQLKQQQLQMSQQINTLQTPKPQGQQQVQTVQQAIQTNPNIMNPSALNMIYTPGAEGQGQFDADEVNITV
jgi:hypothetical protein